MCKLILESKSQTPYLYEFTAVMLSPCTSHVGSCDFPSTPRISRASKNFRAYGSVPPAGTGGEEAERFAGARNLTALKRGELSCAVFDWSCQDAARLFVDPDRLAVLPKP